MVVFKVGIGVNLSLSVDNHVTKKRDNIQTTQDVCILCCCC